jgi:cobalt-zinc-cadmium efflux system membrane fusion protein
MNTMARLIAAVLATTALGCESNGHGAIHGHGHGHEHAERPTEVVTLFSASTELFVEYPALVAGEESAFAAHLTWLSDFRPVASGRVSVVLAGADGSEQRFEVGEPIVPGIFRPVARPKTAGKFTLTIELDAADRSDRHDLGQVTVYPTVDEAVHAAEEEDAGQSSEITFLKEQQWQADFATAPAQEQVLRASLVANGVLHPRRDGEVRVSTPASGRLVTSGERFPWIGMEVERDQVLVEIVPRLAGDTDLASLELAVSQAQLSLDHAESELERLEDLYKEGAVPAKRRIEAQHQEAAARAALAAAKSRLAQYHGTQRATGGEAAGRIAVRSPIAGTVVQVSATPGAFLEEGEELFYVVDLERLWLEVQIPEADIGRVRGTTGAWFEVEGFDRRFEVDPETGGRVVSLGGVVHPRRRTVPLVLELPNPDRALRVGMFARVRVLTGQSHGGVAAPISAVVDEDGRDVVYVQSGGESFERRFVKLGIRDGAFVEVLRGLEAGDRVVTDGAYLIRLAAASTSLPAHGHAH